MEQIKSREAKEVVSAELNYHIQEAKREWGNKGLTDAEAETRAVEQMGNPSLLGVQLNKLHRPRVDWVMIGLLVTILIVGFLPLMSLSDGFLDGDHFYKNKVFFIIIGIGVACALMLVDYRKFYRFGWLFYLIGICILKILGNYPNMTVYGYPFFNIGPLTIESWMAIPFFLLSWASFLQNKKFKLWHWGTMLLLSLYLVLQVNLPAVFIYSVMVFAMIWWSKIGRQHALKLIILTIGILFSSVLIFSNLLAEYQKERFLFFLYPENYADEGGFQYLLIKELMNNAGWFGHTEEEKFIPAAHTDLVFVTFTHYYGWLIAAIVVLILVIIAARIVMTAHKVSDPYGRLLLIGCVSLYAIQLSYNLGMTLGFLPITSIPLPFISYGLMPTLLNAFLVGIVLSVYRRKDLTFVKNTI